MKPGKVPIPERVATRPRDERGYPILYTTAYVGGRPDFRGSDPQRREECYEQKLCGVCGQRLEYWMYFLTGPLGEKNRTFADPPMHRECIEFALEVCPFLAYSKADYTAHRHLNDIIIPDPTHQTTKPDRLGLYQTRGYKRAWATRQTWLFLADAPFKIEWREFKHG